MSGLGSVLILVLASVASAQPGFDLSSVIGREVMGGQNGLPSQGGAGAGDAYSDGLRGGWDGNPNRRPGFEPQGTIGIGWDGPMGQLGTRRHHDIDIGGMESRFGHGFDASFRPRIGASPIGTDMLPFGQEFGGPVEIHQARPVPEFLDPVTGNGVHIAGQSIYGGKSVIPPKGTIVPKKGLKPLLKKPVKPTFHKPKPILPPKKPALPKKHYLGIPKPPMRKRLYRHKMYPKKSILSRIVHKLSPYSGLQPKTPYLPPKPTYRARIKTPYHSIGHKTGFMPHHPLAKSYVGKKKLTKGRY